MKLNSHCPRHARRIRSSHLRIAVPSISQAAHPALLVGKTPSQDSITTSCPPCTIIRHSFRHKQTNSSWIGTKLIAALTRASNRIPQEELFHGVPAHHTRPKCERGARKLQQAFSSNPPCILGMLETRRHRRCQREYHQKSPARKVRNIEQQRS